MDKTLELIAINQSKRQHRDLCLLAALVFVMASCIALYMCLEDDWAENTFTRQRILILSAGLFLSSIGICYYAAKAEPRNEYEVQTLLLDTPPSYNSVTIEDPPPSYSTVIHSILIIPQQETG